MALTVFRSEAATTIIGNFPINSVDYLFQFNGYAWRMTGTPQPQRTPARGYGKLVSARAGAGNSSGVAVTVTGARKYSSRNFEEKKLFPPAFFLRKVKGF